MQDINTEIGKRIRNIREKQKLSREKLAEQADISTQFLADIEVGRKGMTVATLRKLCTALGVSSDLLVFGKRESCTPDDPSPQKDVGELLLTLPTDKRENVYTMIRLIAETVNT